MVKLLVPIVLFSAVFGILYTFIMSKHREKMYMMEHNLDPKEYSLQAFFNAFQTLKMGMLMIGLAIGLLVGHWLAERMFPHGEIAYPAMVLLFGGLSLVLHHIIERRARI